MKERKDAVLFARQIRFWMFPQESPRRTTTYPQKTGITTGEMVEKEERARRKLKKNQKCQNVTQAEEAIPEDLPF